MILSINIHWYSMISWMIWLYIQWYHVISCDIICDDITCTHMLCHDDSSSHWDLCDRGCDTHLHITNMLLRWCWFTNMLLQSGDASPNSCIMHVKVCVHYTLTHHFTNMLLWIGDCILYWSKKKFNRTVTTSFVIYNLCERVLLLCKCISKD